MNDFEYIYTDECHINTATAGDLDTTETETKVSFKTNTLRQGRMHSNLNYKISSCKMFKISKNLSGVNNETSDLNVLSIILSKYEHLSQPSKTMNNLTMVPNPELAIVKFHVQENVTIASAFKTTTTVRDVKECLADVLELDKNQFSLDLSGNEIDQSLTLENFGLETVKRISFDVRSKTGETGQKIIVQKVDENVPTLTVITVHINANGILKDLIVEIEDECCEKEWLGSFRNVKTNIHYYHARSQTLPNFRETVKHTEKGKEHLMFHRDTQTPCPLKDIKVDTVNNKGTQMSRHDLYITSRSDKIIISRPYIDYETYCKENSMEKSVIIIQRAVRKWLAVKRIKSIMNLELKMIRDVKLQKVEILKEEAAKERIAITDAAYPSKRDDFYMLYLMVGNWWKNEWKRINETRSAETKQAEVVALLQKHVQLLREVERHKTIVKKESMQKERMRFLNILAQPITFKNSKGEMTSIDDINTQRAREFKEIYSALIKKEVPTKYRIEMLFVLRNLISGHYMDYEYANDLISLIEREINLLTTGFKMADLKGLHIRIEQLFMNFLENQECNPKAAAYKKPNISKTLPLQFQCYHCKKLLPVSKFPVHVRMNKYNESGCKSCTWMQNLGSQRVDMSPFIKMLKQVQNSEMEKCCHSAVCFIFQPIGMAYLTMKIWHGHSAISECSDVSKLQHVRWLKDVEWTPWNTILLTNQEAKCHTSIPDIFDFYDQSFINSVQQKHILTRSTFMPLLMIDHDIRSSGVWAKVQDEGIYLHPSHAEVFAGRFEYDRI